MTEKELSKLRKPALLRLMLEQQKRIQQLEAELELANQRLDSKRTNLKNVGSIAEASLALTGIFEEAQKAADSYLENVRALAEAETPGDKDGEEGEDGDEPHPSRPPASAEDLPSAEVLEAVLKRERYRRRLARSIKMTVFTLITVSAAAILVAVLLMPVLQIYGSSMVPSLSEGQYVVTLKGGRMETGDIVAFYFNNKVLVKRVIGQPGQWIDIDEDGTVYVDNAPIDEPYLQEGARALGECNIELPYQVPEGRVFVMGDNRAVSVDSRSTTVGCVAEEQLVGRVVYCVWPLRQAGSVS